MCSLYNFMHGCVWRGSMCIQFSSISNICSAAKLVVHARRSPVSSYWSSSGNSASTNTCPDRSALRSPRHFVSPKRRSEILQQPCLITVRYTPLHDQAIIKQTSSKHWAVEHTTCTCILNAFARCLLDDCSMFAWSCKRDITSICICYSTAGIGKRVRSRSWYYPRQCGVVLKPRSDRIENKYCSWSFFV